MSLKINIFLTPDQKIPIYRINHIPTLDRESAKVLRTEIQELVQAGATTLVLDLCDTRQLDLPGVNEIFNTLYTLNQVNGDFTLVFQKDSEVSKWVHITGLDKLAKTAVRPV